MVHAKDKHSTGLELTKATTIWLPKGTVLNQVGAKLKIAQADRSMTHQLKAPVKKGQHVGYVTLKPTGMSSIQLPFKATDNIKKNGWF